MYIAAQILGVVSWVIFLLSYYSKKVNKVLLMQLISSLLDCICYALLNAWSGLLISVFELLKGFGYYKTDKDKYIYIASIPIRIIGGLLTFEVFYDVLPIFASLIDGYSLTKRKKLLVFGAVISYTLWVIYDICVMSISGAITDGIIVISNLCILLFNYNIFKKDGIVKIK